MLRDLETLIERAAGLTRQMLAYAGKARVEVSDLDLNAAIGEMVHLLSVAIPKKVTLAWTWTPTCPPSAPTAPRSSRSC